MSLVLYRGFQQLTDVIISQLADDTTIFLRNASQIPSVMEQMKCFIKVSCPNLNFGKCELTAIKECDVPSMFPPLLLIRISSYLQNPDSKKKVEERS